MRPPARPEALSQAASLAAHARQASASLERLTLRQVTLADSALLLTWRNDPLTRAMSVARDRVEPRVHELWLRARLRERRGAYVIAVLAGEPVGTIRADAREQALRLSWTMAPEHRGRGHGTAMVAQFLPLLEEALIAEIRPENRPSQRIAQRAGLTRTAFRHGMEIWVRGERRGLDEGRSPRPTPR